MNLIKEINNKFENGISKVIFDHVRNMIICTFLLSIGTNQLEEKNDIIFSITQGKYIGISVIIVSFILILINSYDGIRMINKAQFNKLIRLPLTFLYLFLVVKVLEMGWDFRVISY